MSGTEVGTGESNSVKTKYGPQKETDPTSASIAGIRRQSYPGSSRVQSRWWPHSRGPGQAPSMIRGIDSKKMEALMVSLLNVPKFLMKSNTQTRITKPH